jgi:tRNA-splicing ligase RtcB
MQIKKIDDIHWEIPVGTIPGMKVPVLIFASKTLLEKMKTDRTLTQCAGVATLPGIYKNAICLPDGHEGYGFPIGGVAALDYENGGISPGGIGYDINCGVRLLTTNMNVNDLKPKLKEIVNAMFNNVPSGLGSKGKLRIKSKEEFNNVLKLGAKWAVENGYGWKKDLEHLEENGQMKQADPSKVGDIAKRRGMPQLGSLGSGNHFLEIQRVDKIYNPEAAKVFGIEKENQITVMIHTGSRGFGHQVCTDYLRQMERTYPDLIKKLPDRELVYAPAGSQLAKDYFAGMSCAANFAWCNRQMIVHWVRQSFQKVFNKPPEELGLQIVYDVAHNMAKIEEHEIDGKKVKVYLHRKGGTRAFPPNHPEIPQDYQKVGQPVLLPGSMGTASYVLVGAETGKDTFFSTAHGAGRTMSRHAAIKKWRGEQVTKQLGERGIYVKTASWKGAAEEAPGAYKDIDEVARVSDKAGIGKLVARLTPLGVVKG